MALSETISETSLCNQALGRIGATRIEDVEADNSLGAIQCRLHYETTRDALLRSHLWRFASTSIKLVSGWVTATVYTADQYVSNSSVWYKCLLAHTSGALDDEPGTGAVEATYWTTLTAADYTPSTGEYDHIWALPSDFLRMRSIYESDFSDTNDYSYDLEGTNLLTSEDEMDIRYIKKVTDVTKFDPLFVKLLVLLLADEMIGPLSGGDAKIQKKIDTAIDKLMPKVRALDRQETNTSGRYSHRPWVEARYT